MAQHLRRQLAQQPPPITLRQLLKNSIDTLPLGIPHRTQPIPRHSPRHQPRHVRNDKPQRAPAQPAHHAPEFARRHPLLPLSHPLLTQHLLKHIGELRMLGPLPVLALLTLPLRANAAGEEVPRPREGYPAVAWARATGSGVVVVGGVVRAGGEAETAAAVAGEELALGVVVAAARGVGKRVVGVVDELELARAVGVGGVGRWDAVRVCF